LKYFDIKYNIFNNLSDKYIIMLHGWGCNKEIYREYVSLLKNDYNIIVFDLYGFGQSDDPKLFFDIYEYTLQIYLFLVKNNIDTVDIIAHSFGGRIAIILSSIFDIKVNKMVLTGCAGLKPRYNVMYYIKVLVYKITKKFKIKNKLGSVDYRLLNGNLKMVFVRVVNQHLDYLVKSIKSKVLFVWGKEDKDTPLYMFNRFTRFLPKSKRLLLIDSAHFCMFKHSYLCKNKVREFLVFDDNIIGNE